MNQIMCQNKKSALPVKRHGFRKAGFSLIEVLIAIAITGIGLIGIVTTMRQAMRQQVVPEQNQLALGLAQSLVEIVRANPFSVNITRDLVSKSDAIVPNPFCEPQGVLTEGLTAAVCSPDQLAAYTAYRWVQQARELKTLQRELTQINQLRVGRVRELEPDRYQVVLVWKDDIALLNRGIVDPAQLAAVSGCEGLNVDRDPYYRCLAIPFDVPSQFRRN